jgi:hypothetical protein
MVEFEYKGKDKNLGDINDVLSFLDRLYEQGVLRIDANLSNYSYRLWTFVAINPGNDKIKVAKTVEDRIFSLLSLWYFGSRKNQIDTANGTSRLSKRKLLNFFSADTNNAQWPNCTTAYKMLYRGFDITTFYGRDYDKISSQRKDDVVRERFSSVLEAGLPQISTHSLEEPLFEDEDEIGY